MQRDESRRSRPPRQVKALLQRDLDIGLPRQKHLLPGPAQLRAKLQRQGQIERLFDQTIAFRTWVPPAV